MTNSRKLEKGLLKSFHNCDNSRKNELCSYKLYVNHKTWMVFSFFKINNEPQNTAGLSMQCCSLHQEASLWWDTS